MKAPRPAFADGDPCPSCGGKLVICKDAAWCIQKYVDGGCGQHWRKTRSGDWRLVR